LGHPVAHSLSPRMQNAAFAAAGLDWEYVALDVSAAELEQVVPGLAERGFAGANVTAPHKQEVARILGSDLPSVNTIAGGHGYSTDTEILKRVEFDTAVIVGGGGAAAAFGHALPDARVFSRRGDWPPDPRGADLVIHATPVRDESVVEVVEGQTLVDLPYPDSATAAEARERGARVFDGLEVLVAQGAASFELWAGIQAPVEAMRAAIGLPV
jgi:shikimate dehydrogenase